MKAKPFRAWLLATLAVLTLVVAGCIPFGGCPPGQPTGCATVVDAQGVVK
jgi:hypothetical protein